MNIRQKLTGKAFLYDGTNYKEIIDGLEMKEDLMLYWGCNDEEELLEMYKEDAENNDNWALIKRADGNYRVGPNNYIVAIDDVILAMDEIDFNKFYEVIPD